MDITTAIHGTSARITPCGDIDSDTLTPLRAAASALPAYVTEVQWDLRGTPFMDVSGLHLLLPPRAREGAPECRITVTGLQPQPLRLLLLAADMNPGTFGPDRLTATPAGS
ncbi:MULTISPECIES: STAS domain-containing protein [unclassified Streptomyces]|uniref:STAS domain-containing protein n=1 Tax=unclassified Streptomyces TaxID=2593676 RepID=UPI002E80D88B|nr:STAS domain-containing protein [Streptomyces sp. NBC_00523]WUD03611.1 STAS domain-containing protein [Streptomyces sp. NBC_00523]